MSDISFRQAASTGFITGKSVAASRHYLAAVLFVLGLLQALVPAVAAATETVSKEYQIKAAFLYNFTKFVEWPAERFAEGEPIVIAVLGASPFGHELEKIVQNRTVNGRSIEITLAPTVEDCRRAHLVFIGGRHDEELERILPVLHAAGILTVGESRDFVKAGGAIVFVLEGDKVRFEIDMPAAERSGLKISAQLQQLAKNVRRKR